MGDRHHLPPGAMPRMLTEGQAAEYCGVSASTFRGICPKTPKDMGFRGLRWDRLDLDRWLDALPGQTDAAPDPSPAPIRGSKEQALDNAKRRIKAA